MSSPLLKLWLLVVAIAVGVQLGGFPLLDADEGRNAEVAREMAATNDYVMPRLDGLPYLDKPIVYFAAEAAAMELLGPTELAARLPAYLFTLATAALLFFFARRVWGGDAPWIAAIVFLSMPLTISFARTVIFDSALTFFVVVAWVAFYIAIEEKQRRWSVLAWASMGAAMITKGPVTFVLVLFVVIPFAWKQRALRLVFPLAGLLVFAAVIAPWVWGVSQVVPEFLNYVLVTETAQRMATKALKRTGPPWYFLPYLLGGALPWSIVALASWKSLRKREPAMLFLLLAIAVPFVFFSISQSKRQQYILPLMAPLALVIAHIWDEARTRAAAMLLAILGVILLVAPLVFHRTKMKPEVAAVADETAIVLGIASVVGGAIALFAKRRDFIAVALSIPMIVLPAASIPLLRGVAERRSAKSFVAQLAPHLGPRTEVIGVEAFTGSLAFYTGRRITVVTEDASELTSNYLVRRYAKFTSDPSSPLKPLPHFERTLGACCPMYILRNDDARRRALLESRGFMRVAEGAHLVAYTQSGK
ncbi:MAG TPA: glycosyltransferase family 39 protein [Thermoanaerobaculia bacterium]|nr:glycosyltransferase family 39 protein [Thermoanaerobaculia bacterium]